MDIIASPFVTVVLNLIASLLVSKGILDSHSTVAFVQTGNNIIAGLTTTAVAIYTLYKSFDLAKHKLTLTHTKTVSTTGGSQVFTITTPPASQEPVGQTGLPTPPVTQ